MCVGNFFLVFLVGLAENTRSWGRDGGFYGGKKEEESPKWGEGGGREVWGGRFTFLGGGLCGEGGVGGGGRGGRGGEVSRPKVGRVLYGCNSLLEETGGILKLDLEKSLNPFLLFFSSFNL